MCLIIYIPPCGIENHYQEMRYCCWYLRNHHNCSNVDKVSVSRCSWCHLEGNDNWQLEDESLGTWPVTYLSDTLSHELSPESTLSTQTLGIYNGDNSLVFSESPSSLNTNTEEGSCRVWAVEAPGRSFQSEVVRTPNLMPGVGICLNSGIRGICEFSNGTKQCYLDTKVCLVAKASPLRQH